MEAAAFPAAATKVRPLDGGGRCGARISSGSAAATAARKLCRRSWRMERGAARECSKIAKMHKSALVLFSGGQDSTTCLAWSLARYERVETIGFDYRQRNRPELAARARVIDGIRTRFPPWARR